MKTVQKTLVLVEATLALYLAAFLLRWAPRGFSQRLVKLPNKTDFEPYSPKRWEQISVARSMFQKALRQAPFNVLCLPQALAARWMLNRRHVPNTLSIGVDSLADNPVQSLHAWLEVGGEIVLGGPVSAHVAVIRIGAGVNGQENADDAYRDVS